MVARQEVTVGVMRRKTLAIAGSRSSHPNEGLSQCHGCATEDVVTPHGSFLALDVAPQQAYANIQALRTLYPGVYGADGFFDAVSPATGAVGHRYLVLDQSMISMSGSVLPAGEVGSGPPGDCSMICRSFGGWLAHDLSRAARAASPGRGGVT
jgi:hypothetical protein